MAFVGVWRCSPGVVLRRGVFLATVTFLAAALAGGCGASGRATGGGSGSSVVEVTVENFKIDAPPVIHAGLVRFIVTGAGPSMHELNVARTGLAADRLPLAADGTVDDQEPHLGFVHLAEVEGIDTGQHKTLTVRLIPGSYVLYCNMDGHYLAGMTASLRVVS